MMYFALWSSPSQLRVLDTVVDFNQPASRALPAGHLPIDSYAETPLGVSRPPGEVAMSELVVTRLLQNPLGQIAPSGHRGDMIRVSDGTAAVYLLPAEFEALDDEMLRTVLSLAAHRSVADGEPGPLAVEPDAEALPGAPSATVRPSTAPPRPATRSAVSAASAGGSQDKAGSATSPRRASRPAQSLW
jgi:hypothetical protein